MSGPSCVHEWGAQTTLYYTEAPIAYGVVSTCKKCRARLFDDWTATRSGGIDRILPPLPPTPEEVAAAMEHFG